jgi:CspA family cold shock protein
MAAGPKANPKTPKKGSRSKMAKGKIKAWKDERGFGFIVPDDGGTDIFFHVTEVADDAGDIAVGREVKFEIGKDPKTGRSKAVNVDFV